MEKIGMTCGKKFNIITLRNNYKQIIKLYNQGVSSKKIGKIFNCSRNTIVRVLKKNNIPIDGNRIRSLSLKKDELRTPKMINKIKSLIQNGKATKEIGRIIGIDCSTIKRILKENNIQIPKYIRNEETRKLIGENTKRYLNNLSEKQWKERIEKCGYHRWTKKEDNYLIKNFNCKLNYEIKKELDISIVVIKSRLRKLGLIRDNRSKVCSAAQQGVSLDKWEKFTSFEPYDKKFNIRFKKAIRKRDNQICLMCGVHREKLPIALCVHHINYNKLLTIPENCCSLCRSCNILANKNRKHWTKFFQSILSEKYGYQYDENQLPIINVEIINNGKKRI